MNLTRGAGKKAGNVTPVAVQCQERFTEDGDSQSETSYEFIYEQFDGAPTMDQVEMVEKASLEMYRPIWTVLNGCIGPGEPLWSILLCFLRP